MNRILDCNISGNVLPQDQREIRQPDRGSRLAEVESRIPALTTGVCVANISGGVLSADCHRKAEMSGMMLQHNTRPDSLFVLTAATRRVFLQPHGLAPRSPCFRRRRVTSGKKPETSTTDRDNHRLHVLDHASCGRCGSDDDAQYRQVKQAADIIAFSLYWRFYDPA